MTPPPLPGAWRDFGPDVVHLAAHPTKPWLAIVREDLGGPPTVEHYDLTTECVVERAEAPQRGHNVVWLGDRIVLVCLDPEPDALVLPLTATIAVAFVREPESLLSTSMRASNGCVELSFWGRQEALLCRLVDGTDSTAITTATVPPITTFTHPDGHLAASLAYEDEVWTLELGDSNTLQSIALPPQREPSYEVEFRLLGWISATRILLRRINAMQEHSGPTRYWYFDLDHRVFVQLPLAIAESCGSYFGALSPDGSRLAVEFGQPSELAVTMLLVDAHTGATLRPPVALDSFEYPDFFWLGNDLVAHVQRPIGGLGAARVTLADVRGGLARYTFSAPEHTHIPVDGLTPFAVDRLLIPSHTRDGFYFLSDPLTPTATP